MLVLSRKEQESIIIADTIKITIVKIESRAIRIGIDAPPEIHVLRSELIREIDPEDMLVPNPRLLKKFQ